MDANSISMLEGRRHFRYDSRVSRILTPSMPAERSSMNKTAHRFAALFAIVLVFTSSLNAADKPRILMLTQSAGFKHGSVNRKEKDLAVSEVAMIQLGESTGEFTVDCTQDAAADITKENLQKYDVVMFYTTGKLPIADEHLDYLLTDWIRQKGHGFIGFHSATDTYKDHEPYWDFIGGSFAGHPWNAGTTVTMKVHDTSHPAMKPFGDSYVHTDEIYQYKNWQPEKVHVLMSLDMEKTQLKKPYHVPVAWCKQVGQGRMFYNNMGHREDTWQKKEFLDSVTAAVKWVTGQVDGDAAPNPDVSAAHHAASKAAADAGEEAVKKK